MVLSHKFSPHALIFFLALFVAVTLTTTASAATRMPEFTLDDVKTGKPIPSFQFAGKAKLVVFFATWCMPCMQEVPALMSLQEEYGDEQFTVIAISVDRRSMDVVRFINRAEINYPVLMADKSIIRAFGGIPGLPTSFLINSKGIVLKKFPGLVPHALLEREIKAILP